MLLENLNNPQITDQDVTTIYIQISAISSMLSCLHSTFHLPGPFRNISLEGLTDSEYHFLKEINYGKSQKIAFKKKYSFKRRNIFVRFC